MAPPRDTSTGAARAAGAGAAAGVGAGAVAAPALAAPSAVGLAGVVGAGVITAAMSARLLKALITGLDDFMEMRFTEGALFLAAVLAEQFPDRRKREIQRVVSREGEFEVEFRRKMKDRLKRDLPKALAISDPAVRTEAVTKLLNREKRFTQMREDAMVVRGIARMEMNLLQELSPQGAFWKLSPHVKEHTLDCLAMGEKFWPWAVLRKVNPPLHAGCPCELWGLDEAIEEGLMTADQVPDEKDAIAHAARLGKEVDDLQALLGIEEAMVGVEEILRGYAGTLVEAKPSGNTGAMVALYPEPSVARKLAQEGGEDVRELHVTLGFLGKAKDLKDHGKLRKIVEGVAAASPPLTGEVSGVGVFTAGPEPVTYASVDVPALPEVRQRLVDALGSGGFPPSKEHGFTPHMTLAYDERRDLKLAKTKLRFERLTLVLGDKRYHYRLDGRLEESRADPLRWAKGFVKGGQFRPRRGGNSARVIAKKLLGDGPPSAPTTGRRRGDGRWTWVRGAYTRIPSQMGWERRHGSTRYHSPPGSTNLYRNGKLVNEPGQPSPPEERRRLPQMQGGMTEQVEERVAELRTAGRKAALSKAEAAARMGRASKSPVSKGDGPEALLSLPHAGFEVKHTVPRSGGATDIEFERGNAQLRVSWNGEQITEVEWEPSPPSKIIRSAAQSAPRSFKEYQKDALAWADELGLRFNAEVDFPELRVDPSLWDHSGQHQWTGEADIGRDSPRSIDRMGLARDKGRDLSWQELGNAWATYWVTAHEMGHSVNPISPLLFVGGHANLEEALTEEASHVLAVERLTEQGQQDVVDWRNQNPTSEVVHGNYRRARHVLSLLFDEAKLTDQNDRRNLIFELKFQTDPVQRYDRITERIHSARGGDMEEIRERVESFFDHATEPEGGFQYGRPVLVFDKSPGLAQVGRSQHGKMRDGELSDDARLLTMPDGHRRRVERLPLVAPDLKGKTDGTAVTAYRPGDEMTDGLTLKDGRPKNFRYVDSADRAKLILRAFAGKGSPGVIPHIPDAEVRRAVEEINAAKGLLYVDGVPVKRRFDGSYGVGWYNDGRNLSGVAGVENAASLALIRSQIDPPWGNHNSAWGRGGEEPFADFMVPEPPHSPGGWLSRLERLFDIADAPKHKKPKKKYKPPKPVYIGGVKDTLPVEGPIPAYDHMRLRVGEAAGGSNGARWAFDAGENRWLLKTYWGDRDRIATELLANAIYREMGAKVAEAGTIMVKGNPALTYPTLEGKVRPSVFSREGPSEAVGEHYMVDALTANWDFVGLSDDNIMWDPDGKPFRVDQGGTFEFRAMGGDKPYGPVPTEVWTMRSKGQAARGAKVSEDQMREQAKAIAKKLTAKKVDDLVDAAPFEDQEMRERVRENLWARIGWMDSFTKGEVDLPRPLEGDEAMASLVSKEKGFDPYPEQEDALFGFMEGAYGEVNKDLRHGKGKRSKVIQRAIDEMDSLVRAVKPTDEDVIAYVGLDMEPEEGDEDFGLDLVGQTLEEKGFLMATLDADEATHYATVMRLVIPEGSHLVYTPGLNYSDLPPEPQVILARKSKLRIVERRVVDGKVHFDVTVKTERPWKPWKAKPVQKATKVKKDGKPWKIDKPLEGDDAAKFLKDLGLPDDTLDKEPPEGSDFWDDIDPPENPLTPKSPGGEASPWHRGIGHGPGGVRVKKVNAGWDLHYGYSGPGIGRVEKSGKEWKALGESGEVLGTAPTREQGYAMVVDAYIAERDWLKRKLRR